MPTARIAKTIVDAAQPEPKDWILRDDRLGGFGLKVTPAGSKVYIFQYHMGGRGAKVRRFTIGKHGKLTTEGARKKAEMLALSVANGVDPQREKVREVRKAIDLAFKPYVERFYQDCLLKEWPATHKYVHSLLVTYAVPVISNTPLPDITRKDIKAALAPVLDKTATASNLFAVLRRMFSWAVEQEDIDRSPIEEMKARLLAKHILVEEELDRLARGIW